MHNVDNLNSLKRFYALDGAGIKILNFKLFHLKEVLVVTLKAYRLPCWFFSEAFSFRDSNSYQL